MKDQERRIESHLVGPPLPADVLLVQPPHGGSYNFWKSESLGMGYLAAALESRGYSVAVLDAFFLDLEVETVVQQILAAPPRLLLGFSMLSYELYRSGDVILRRLREAGLTTHVTVGSWFPTFWYGTMLEEGMPVDSVILAEGERSICDLADYLRTGRWATVETVSERASVGDALVLRQKAPIADLDTLPHPRRDYLPEVFQRYHLATSHTSRGCGYGHCTFCSVPQFFQGGAGHRQRSAENVISEIAAISDRGANFLFLCDEDFVGNSPAGAQRALRIFEGAAERGVAMRYTFNCTTQGVEEGLFRKLVDLGLAAVYIGLESNLDRVLKLLGKGVRRPEIDRAVAVLRDLGVKLVPGWIMFERQTTLDEVEAQIEFLSRLGSYHVNYLKSLYVMRDTPIASMYGDDLYSTYFHTRFFFRDPDVDLLVRILMSDYLPETMPYTNGIYPVWHRLLAGYGTKDQQGRYERVNARMRELSLGFTTEAIARIRTRSLAGLARTLTDHVRAWQTLGVEIDQLAWDLGHDKRRMPACAE